MPKRIGMQIEDFGRAVWSLDHSGGQLEGRQDMFSLDFLQAGEFWSRITRGRSFRRRVAAVPVFLIWLIVLPIVFPVWPAKVFPANVFGERRRSQFVLQLEGPTARKNDRAFHHVLEFPDISGPGIAQDAIHGALRYFVDLLSEFFRVIGEEELRQFRD